jgi:hypothetical protein
VQKPFINLPITVLTMGKTFQQLMQLKSSPLNIEIVEPASFQPFGRAT